MISAITNLPKTHRLNANISSIRSKTKSNPISDLFTISSSFLIQKDKVNMELLGKNIPIHKNSNIDKKSSFLAFPNVFNLSKDLNKSNLDLRVDTNLKRKYPSLNFERKINQFNTKSFRKVHLRTKTWIKSPENNSLKH